MQPHGCEAIAVQFPVPVFRKFYSFYHNLVIFSIGLFAFETIYQPFPLCFIHPTNRILKVAGTDIYPVAGGKGGRFYLHASVIPNGIAIHAPLSFLISARMNCLLMAGW